MPKTKKKRSQKAPKHESATNKNDTEKSNADIRSEETGIGDQASSIVNISNLTESDLKVELQAELKRLQDEYKRQKDLTNELEQEREKLQLGTVHQAIPGSNTSVLPSPTIPESEYKPDEQIEPFLAPGYDQQYMSDLEIEKRINDSVGNIKGELAEIKERLGSKLDFESIKDLQDNKGLTNQLSKTLSGFNKELTRMHKDVERNDQKLTAILLDLGFEESLDINKVPNYILVLVYETILNDIIARIQHGLGNQDTEAAVNNTLEDIRTHTSGGELFKFEHNKIKIPELRQYLEKKTISPKQIHITFNSIIEKLLEYIPGYSPKNFKAMIKIMSHEYSLDTAAKLDQSFESLENRFSELEENVNKILKKKQDSDAGQSMINNELKNMNLFITNLSKRIDDLPNVIEKQIEEKLSNYSFPQSRETQVDTQVPESEKEPETEPESEPQTESESETEEPEPETESEPETEPEDESKVEAEDEPETEPESEPETESESENPFEDEDDDKDIDKDLDSIDIVISKGFLGNPNMDNGSDEEKEEEKDKKEKDLDEDSDE